MLKLKKTTIICTLIITFTTGLVYASTLLGDKVKKAEPVKWDTTNIKINLREEIIKKNMTKYNDETYILQVKDYNKLKEVINLLSITYENNDAINESTFAEYEFLFIVSLNHKKISVANVLPYDDKITIVFDERNEMIEDKNSFCIWIPKKYNKDTIEIIYDESKEDIPTSAINFKFSEFYIDNVEEFYRIDIKYNEDQNYYALEIFNINQYNELVQKLGLKTYRKIKIENLNGTKMILICKKGKNKLELNDFRLKGNILHISLKEINEQYGYGITGALIVFEKRFESYSIKIE